MNRCGWIRFFGIVAALVIGGGRFAAAAATADKPNILLIMADDMGFSDLGCYGGEIATPHLDSLAAGGLRFRHFYNTGRCCPTRASLLTGLYPHKAGMGWMTTDLGHPGYAGDLNAQCVTIAQVLKPAGYRNYAVGKWHVTSEMKAAPDSAKFNWPLQRGFDRYYGALSGGGSYYTPRPLVSDNTPIEAPAAGYYYTDAIGDYAMQFLTSHFAEHADAPFFMYVAFYAPHRPLHAKPDDIEKYLGKYTVGWDRIRADRFKRQQASGLLGKDWELSARDADVPAWTDVPEKQKALWDKRMATYAAQVDCMDQNIGRILGVLKEKGQLDKTVIFFLSDNGGCAEPAGNGNVKAIGTAATNESYRTAWANASNTPFRRYKKESHEGGVATPLIVHWKGLETAAGSFCDTLGHVIDLMPTCADLAGASYPKTFGGKDITPCAGKSLVPAFASKDVPREALYFEHQANRAVRQGRWKLVSGATTTPPYTGPWELYDMETDPTERHDLAGQQPERVKTMAALWHQWALDNNVYPLDSRKGVDRKSKGNKTDDEAD